MRASVSIKIMYLYVCHAPSALHEYYILYSAYVRFTGEGGNQSVSDWVSRRHI